jgi:phage-related protein
MERNLRQAVRRVSPLRIRVEADLRPFGHSIDTLANLDAVQIPITPEVDRDDFQAAITAALAGLEVPVRVVPDLDDFDERIRAHRAPDITVQVNGDTDRLSRALGILGRAAGAAGVAVSALKFGAIAGAAAVAAQAVVLLTSALEATAGAAFALPAVIGGVAVAMGTLKLATAGVGEALKALIKGDAEKAAQAIEKLSPAAQTAIKALQELGPQFKELQQSVQEAFFDRFADQVKAAAENLLPLGKNLSGVAQEFGNAASSALDFAATPEALQSSQKLIDGTRSALTGLTTAIQPVIKGLLDVAAAVSEAFGKKLGDSIGQAGAKFGTFLSTIAASGEAVDRVQRAIDTFKQLGRILGNVKEIFSGLFKAAAADGEGFLDTIENITQRFSDFVNSTAGQTAIGNLFSALAAIASQLISIFKALVIEVGAIAPAIEPIFAALGPAIVNLIEAIGPAIQALLPGIQDVAEGIADAFDVISDSGVLTTLGEGLGTLLSALSPLIPVIAEFAAIVGSVLGVQLKNLGDLIAPIAEALAGALLPVLPILRDAFITLYESLNPVVQVLGPVFAEAISALAPLLSALAVAFQQIVEAVAPLVVQIVEALAPALPPLVEVFTTLVQAILPLVPVIVSLVEAVTPLLGLVLSLLAPVLQFGAAVIGWVGMNVVIPIIQGIVTALTGIIGAITTVITAVSGFVQTVIGFFSNLGTNVSTIVSSLVSSVTGFFTGLAGTVSGIVSGIVSSVVTFFAGLPGRVGGALASLGGTLLGVFNAAKAAVVGVVTALIGSVVTLFSGLPGKIKSALGNLGSLLVQAGRDLIQGMINGIQSMAGALLSKAKGVVGDAVSGVKGLLGISSPSKVFKEIGRDVGRGLVIGLTGSEQQIKQAADKLAASITKAFKGKKTDLDDVLIKRLRNTEKRLLSLAKRRDEIADRIKKANEFAASTTQAALNAFSLPNIAQKRGTGLASLTDGLEDATAKIRNFTNKVNILAKKGLRKDLLRQIIGLGPEQGTALATSLANASATQIKDLNAAQATLDKAAKKLGTDSADILFDSGKQASKGFLAGLKAQQKDIEKLMIKIAKSIQAAIKKALGIKSPSRVMAAIGRQTMDGLTLGVDDRITQVRRSATNAATALTDPFGSSPSLRLPGRGATTGGNAVTNNRTVAPVFNITEAGNAEVTAQRMLNRLATVGGGL